MAKRFLTDINLTGNQLQNATLVGTTFEKLSADPTTNLFEGRIYYNTVDDGLKVYNGTVWVGVGAITSVVEGTDINVTVVNGVATVSLEPEISSGTTGNAATATKLATARAIQLSGDVTGTADFDGSAAINIATTIAANSVALGTDTTGNYVASVSTSDGISGGAVGSEGATIALTNTDKGSSQNIFKNVSDGITSVVADNNNDTLTLAAGTGVSVTANATTDTLTIANTGVTSITGTANQIAASSGGVGAVTLSLPSAVIFPGTVTLNADPTQALQAATKQYVDAVAEGLHIHASVAVATTANIANFSAVPATIDGVTLTDQMRVLVKDQTTASQNGIYVYTLSTTTLSRASDFNTAAEIQGGDFVFVTGGTTHDNDGFVQTEKVTTLGTDPISWVQFSGAGTYVGGNGIDLVGNSFRINTTVTADLTTAQTLTNKTLTSPTVSGLYLSDNNIVIEGTADAFETTLTFTDPTADRTITFKNESGTVALLSDIPAAYTDEQAQDAVGNNLSGSNSLAATYNDAAGTFAFDTTLATTSYMSKTSGLAVDASALGTKLVTDGFTKKVSATVGNGTNTSFTVTHNLNTRDVQVEVYDTHPMTPTYDSVEVDVIRTSVNVVTVSFATAPANNGYRVVIVG